MSAELTSADLATLERFARVVLPSTLDAAARSGAVDAFARWVAGYEAGAEMDHGYGFTRLRETGEHPAAQYGADLADLRRRARQRFGSDPGSLDDASLRQLAAQALDSRIEGEAGEALPGRPDSQHALLALMTHWFRSPSAQDIAYGVRIGRESCRGLFIGVDGLEPLAGD